METQEVATPVVDTFDALVTVSGGELPVETPANPVETPARNEKGQFAAKAVEADTLVDAKPTAEKKPRNDPQARIDELTRLRREAERERDQLRAELEAARQPKAPAPPTVTDAEPDPTDLTKYPEGQYDRKYVADQARWSARQELQAQAEQRERESALEAQTRQRVDRERAIGERITKSFSTEDDVRAFADQHASFLGMKRFSLLTEAERKVAKAGNIVAEVFFQVDPDHPRELIEELAKPEIRQRIATLPPEQMFRELAKLDARLGTAHVPASVPAPPVSKAKPPIRPVESSPVASDPYDLADDLSPEEYIRRANARERAARRG